MGFDNIPDVGEWTYRTVKGLVEGKAAENGEAPLMHYEGESYSYMEINQRANAIAHSLAEIGVKQGDTVAAVLNNSVEYLSFWFGVNKLGAVLVPVNVSLKSDGLAYILNDSDAELVVIEEETRENYETARDQLEAVTQEFVLDGDATEGYRPFADLQANDCRTNPDVEVGEDECASIIYTSGTTGLPKGVMLPHFSYINTGWEFVNHVSLDETDRPFTTLPLFHCNAQQLTVMGSMLADTDFAMMRWFSASEFWNQVRAYDATLFHYIGTMIQVLYNREEHPADAEHDVRLGIGAAAPQDIIPAFENRFGLELLEGYGQTELATAVTSVAPGESHKSAEGKIGDVWDHVELRLVDENDDPVPQGEEGEIVARPTRPNTIMLGYYGKPEKTVETWSNLWHHTGDIGKVDEDGELQFVDRKSFFIRRRGENVSSYEVENAVASHSAVEESAAVGVPSDLGEEDIKIVVRTKPGVSVEPVEIVQHCEAKLAYFKVPRYVEFVDSFPKTETERIQKEKLAETGVEDAFDHVEAGYEVDR
jgi:acyl-CoA synthetase (AMP-forming)/AMP-acid ligase II